MTRYMDRLYDESANLIEAIRTAGRKKLKPFPIKIRGRTCDRVSYPLAQLKRAYQRRDIQEIERLRSEFARTAMLTEATFGDDTELYRP